MRACLLLLIILTLPTSATDKKKPARKPAQVDSKSKLAGVFQSYLACRAEDQRKLEPIKNCVQPLLAPKTEQYRLDRLATWLLMAPEVSLIRDCTAAELEERKYFPEKTRENLCFEFTLGGPPKTGIVYFNTTGGKSYLYSFDY